MSLSKLDGPQVLQSVLDEAASALRITGTIVSAPGSGIVDVAIDNTSDSIAIGTSSSLFTGSVSGSKFGLDVNVLNPTTGLSLTGSISGTFQPTGLQNGLSTTALFASSTIQVLPTIPNQNGISVRVWLPTSAIVYFGPSSMSPSNGYGKFYKEEITMDIRDTPNVALYYMTEGSATAELRLMSIS